MGKSTGMLEEDILPVIDSGAVAVLLKDPHRSLGLAAAYQALALGHGDRLLIEDLDQVSWTMGFDFTTRSDHPDPAEREKENRLLAREFMEASMEDRGVPLDERPQIKEWGMAAMKLWQYTPGEPLLSLPFAFRPGTEAFERMIQTCTDRSIAYKFAMLAKFNSAVALYNAVGGAARAMEELFEEPGFKYRIGALRSLREFVERKGILILLGGEDDGLNRKIMRLVDTLVSQIVREHWARAQEPLWVRVYDDEAASVGLTGLREARGCAQELKKGKSRCIASQISKFGHETIDTNVMQNTFEHRWYGCNDPEVAKLAAADLKLLLDLYREHSREDRERYVFGGYETYETESRSILPDGKEDGRRRTTGERTRQRKVVDTTVRYVPLGDQSTLNEVKLMELSQGECYIRFGKQVVFHRVDPPRNRWGLAGLGEDMLRDLIEQQRRDGLYRRPEVESCTTIIETTAKKTAKKPNANPKGRGGKKPAKS